MQCFFCAATLTSTFPSMYSRAGCSSISGSLTNCSRVEGVRTREGIDIACLLSSGQAKHPGRGDDRARELPRGTTAISLQCTSVYKLPRGRLVRPGEHRVLLVL